MSTDPDRTDPTSEVGSQDFDRACRFLDALVAAVQRYGVPHAWTWVFAPILVLGLSILFRVRRKDLMLPLLGGLVVWLGVEAGSGLGFWQGTFIGEFLLMTASLLFARASGLPATIILLPAVMLLVPGVAALDTLYAEQTLGLVEGLRSMSNVMVQIAAILGGVLLGGAVLSVRQAAISTITSKRSRGGT